MDRRKYNDCYYFFYSTCSKGDSCPYRHCIAALGKSEVCKHWLKNACSRQNCPFRHMDSQRDRSTMQCYYESKDGGCLKPHCAYLHLKSRDHLKAALEKDDSSVILPVRCDKNNSLDSDSDIETLPENSCNSTPDSEQEEDNKPKQAIHRNALLKNLRKLSVSEELKSRQSKKADNGQCQKVPAGQGNKKPLRAPNSRPKIFYGPQRHRIPQQTQFMTGPPIMFHPSPLGLMGHPHPMTHSLMLPPVPPHPVRAHLQGSTPPKPNSGKELKVLEKKLKKLATT